jgi:hypothetical protein
MKIETYRPGVPNWVELTSDDPEAARAFYRALLGGRRCSLPHVSQLTTIVGAALPQAAPLSLPCKPAAIESAMPFRSVRIKACGPEPPGNGRARCSAS